MKVDITGTTVPPAGWQPDQYSELNVHGMWKSIYHNIPMHSTASEVPLICSQFFNMEKPGTIENSDKQHRENNLVN